MNPHTPYIVAAYAAATIILLFTAIAPILHGGKLRLRIKNLAQLNKQHNNNSD